MKILLGAGASMMVRTVDLDMQSSMQFPAGSTPLHLAAQRGQIAILQAMLQVRAATLPYPWAVLHMRQGRCPHPPDLPSNTRAAHQLAVAPNF